MGKLVNLLHIISLLWRKQLFQVENLLCSFKIQAQNRAFFSQTNFNLYNFLPNYFFSASAIQFLLNISYMLNGQKRQEQKNEEKIIKRVENCITHTPTITL